MGELYNMKENVLCLLNKYGKTLEDIDHSLILRLDDDKYVYHTVHKGDGLDIDKLDFEYDAGYGIMNVDGFIAFKDGTWMERREYDGSEWWEYKDMPRYEDYAHRTENTD